MDRSGWLLPMWVMVCLTITSRSGAQDLDLAGVIDKGIAAAGGEDRLTRLKAQTWKSKITIHSGDEPEEIEGSYTVEWPDKFRAEIKNGYILVRSGDEAWIRQGDEQEELNADRLLFMKEDAYVNWLRTLVPLRQEGYSLRSVPGIEVEGKPTVGVRVIAKGHRDVVILFDKQTFLVAKVESKSRGMGERGELAQIETYYSEYQEVAGTMVSTRAKVIRNGELFMEIENSEIKRMESAPPELFQKPQSP